MNDRSIQNEDYLEEDSFSIVEFLQKYLRYWLWFLIGALAALFIGYLYMNYAPVLYATSAKVKIIDESQQPDLASDAKKDFWGLSTVNLDNEIEVFKSHRLLQQVVTDLNLDVNYYSVGFLNTSQVWNPPFVVRKFTAADSLIKTKKYDVKLQTSGFGISDEDGNDYLVRYDTENNSAPGLPFSIELTENIDDINREQNYKVTLNPISDVTEWLKTALRVEPTNKKGEILTLSLTGGSRERSEAIVNKVIEKFNQDGVEDKQALSKRTLDFIDERFIYLTGELDSIESGKQDFKKDNSLAYIEQDATTILKRKSDAEDELFSLETQLSLSRLLRSAVVKEEEYGLLPPDIGLDNSSINALVAKYNELSRERNKLSASVQEGHPMMKTLARQLNSSKENILKTLEVNQRQLSASLARLRSEKATAGEMFSRIPEKEKMLRAIERQQSIKENLFLMLLSKREEAAIKNAITAPVVKIIDYAQTKKHPVSPRKIVVYPASLVIGLLAPFLFLFVSFALDTKIKKRSDVEHLNPEIPILGEIPYIENYANLKIETERNLVTESFRILCANLAQKESISSGKTILVASSIKGEGKTATAVNLARAFASIKKKVLLIGADLRNPKLHDHFKLVKEGVGFSDFIVNPELDWRECIHNLPERQMSSLYICLSGTETTDPPVLFAHKNMARFFEQAKMEFDCIIVDTAPTLLVSDTRLISKYADITLFVLRADFTEKRLLDFSKDLNRTKALPKMNYVLNAVGSKSTLSGYNYGYGYGYDAEPDVSENKLEVYGEKLKRGLKYLIVNAEKLAAKMFKKKNSNGGEAV